MQRRLRDPSAANKLQSIQTSDATLLISAQNADVDNILSFEHDDNRPVSPQSGDFLKLDDEVDEEDLLDNGYESEWEDLFQDRETTEGPVDDEDMLDFPNDDHDERMFSSSLEDDSSVLEDMLEL
jgi:hypothetical protein